MAMLPGVNAWGVGPPWCVFSEAASNYIDSPSLCFELPLTHHGMTEEIWEIYFDTKRQLRKIQRMYGLAPTPGTNTFYLPPSVVLLLLWTMDNVLDGTCWSITRLPTYILPEDDVIKWMWEPRFELFYFTLPIKLWPVLLFRGQWLQPCNRWFLHSNRLFIDVCILFIFYPMSINKTLERIWYPLHASAGYKRWRNLIKIIFEGMTRSVKGLVDFFRWNWVG